MCNSSTYYYRNIKLLSAKIIRKNETTLYKSDKIVSPANKLQKLNFISINSIIFATMKIITIYYR